MTVAFDKFMKQHNMTGSEKADGYSSDAFSGLDVQEKDMVFKLLLTELPWSAEWIFLLDPENACKVLKEKEERLRADPYGNVFMIQEQLFKNSGDLLYQEHMIEDYFNYIDRSKPLVVESISRTPTTEATLAFFKQLILVETNATAVARASRHLLDAMKFHCDSDEDECIYTRLLGALRSESIQDKRRALAEIEKGEGNSSIKS